MFLLHNIAFIPQELLSQFPFDNIEYPISFQVAGSNFFQISEDKASQKIFAV
jgi:hypothetical protein